MRPVDLDRERSERRLSLAEFLAAYNEGLPTQFPRASRTLLEAYQRNYPGQFVRAGDWSLGEHRKKVMDWLPAHLKSLER
jgi:hypothetical protein